MAGSFAELPFSLTMPDGWVFGNPKEMAAGLAALQKSDTADAKKLQALLAQSQTFTSEFIAYDVSSSDAFTPNIGCNTLDRREDLSVADTLAQGQVQNVAAIAEVPGIIGKPTADRMTLPVGEAVRVRWQWKVAASGTDAASIGYLFVAGPTVYTCVFSAAPRRSRRTSRSGRRSCARSPRNHRRRRPRARAVPSPRVRPRPAASSLIRRRRSKASFPPSWPDNH